MLVNQIHHTVTQVKKMRSTKNVHNERESSEFDDETHDYDLPYRQYCEFDQGHIWTIGLIR